MIYLHCVQRSKFEQVMHYICQTKHNSTLKELEISFPLEKIAYANAFWLTAQAGFLESVVL